MGAVVAEDGLAWNSTADFFDRQHDMQPTAPWLQLHSCPDPTGAIGFRFIEGHN